jgi:D-alanyl-D-alanine carboxypeptidase
MKRQAIVWLVSIMASVQGHADGLDDASRSRIDHAVTAVLERTQTPSASIAVIKDGKIAYVHAYGLARLSPATKAAPATRYQIASLSKQIVAAAALLLQQDGKLSLDDKVAKWLPDLTAANVITLRQCLTHTAGYPDFWPQDYVMPWMQHPTSTDAILTDWAKRPLSFDPGSDWQYSNTGYVVAGRIIEMAAGQPLFDFVNERIFHPLAITDAFDVNQAPLEAPDAQGYLRAALGPPQTQLPAGTGWMFGAWEFALSAEDLAKWNLSILHHTLLSADSYDAQLTSANARMARTPATPWGYISETVMAAGSSITAARARAIYRQIGSIPTMPLPSRCSPIPFPVRPKGILPTRSTSSFCHRKELTCTHALSLTAFNMGAWIAVNSLRTSTLSWTLERAQRTSTRSGLSGHRAYSCADGSDERGGMKFYGYRVVAGGQSLDLSVYVSAEGKFEQFLVAAATP